jgi:hypothetical protein
MSGLVGWLTVIILFAGVVTIAGSVWAEWLFRRPRRRRRS